ncbi:MAG: hypothetical protein ABJ275_06900 [Maricaulaceae bacterium]
MSLFSILGALLSIVIGFSILHFIQKKVTDKKPRLIVEATIMTMTATIVVPPMLTGLIYSITSQPINSSDIFGMIKFCGIMFFSITAFLYLAKWVLESLFSKSKGRQI